MPDDLTDLQRELHLATTREAAANEQVALLERRLLDAEYRLARMAELELELRELSVALTESDAELERTRELLEAARREREEQATRSDVVRQGMESSLSWRITAPLRAGKARARHRS